MRYQLEICAFTIQSCLIAERAGAFRIELCDNPIEGGTTPSWGTIKTVRDRVSIRLFPIIRPRALDYFYDDDEWQIMKDDIIACRDLGCDGISIGTQMKDGRIDADRMRRIVELAYPMEVTCNRAFDAVPDPFEALEILIDAGCKRILTSGLAATAPLGSGLLNQLVQKAGGRINIMPGAGVRSDNLKQLINETGALEYHTSARKKAESMVDFFNPEISDAGNMFIADEEEISKIVRILERT